MLHQFNDIGEVNNLRNDQSASRVKKMAVLGVDCERFLTIWRSILDMNGRDVEVLLPSEALSQLCETCQGD